MAKPPLFFISPEQVKGRIIEISEEDVRHILSALRLAIGDRLAVCDGTGTEYTTRITRIGRSELAAEIETASKRDMSGPRVTLGQGLPKSDKMDLIVQKATELGVSRIVPLVTARTVVKVRDEEKRTVRWRKIAREAAMQSRRPDIPAIESIQPLDGFLREPAAGPGTLLLLPWEEATAPLKNVLAANRGAESITVLIGPEGGFSGAEAASAKERGFHAVSLGRTVLRTETAAIAAMSMIGYEYQ